MNTIDKINNLIEAGKVYEYAGRCWFTCYMTYSKLTKKQKSEVVLIEGNANGYLHYWLEVNGVVVDPHYKLIYGDMEVESEYSYKSLKKYDLSKVVVDKECYEEKPAVNWLDKEKWAKVYSLEF